MNGRAIQPPAAAAGSGGGLAGVDFIWLTVPPCEKVTARGRVATGSGAARLEGALPPQRGADATILSCIVKTGTSLLPASP
jgi:hypothetical protein